VRLLTVKETCEEFKMSRVTLYNRIGERKFGSYKNGRKTLLDADEIEAWLKKTRREAIPARK